MTADDRTAGSAVAGASLSPAAATIAADLAGFRRELLRFAVLQLRDQASAEDAVQETMLAALEGSRAADLTGVHTHGLRIGVLQTAALDHLRDGPRAAYEAALARLTDAGVTFENFAAPELTTALAQAPLTFAPEAYGTWKHVIEAAPEKMFDQILERFRGGAAVSGPDFVRAWQILDDCREVWNARVAGYDAVIIPSAQNMPPNLDRLIAEPDYFVTENLLTLANTRIGNVLGLSAITLPVSGHPSCGVMLMGKPFGEEALLRIAAACEPVLKAV